METLDKLYLELSRLTSVRNDREIALQQQIDALIAASGAPNPELLAKALNHLSLASGEVQTIMIRTTGEINMVVLQALLNFQEALKGKAGGKVQ